MNNEQHNQLAPVQKSAPETIIIKKTGWKEINLHRHSHSQHQIIYTLSGTLHIQIESTSYFIPEKHVAWIPAYVEHELSSRNRQVSLVVYYIACRIWMLPEMYSLLCHECRDCRKLEIHRF